MVINCNDAYSAWTQKKVDENAPMCQPVVNIPCQDPYYAYVAHGANETKRRALFLILLVATSPSPVHPSAEQNKWIVSYWEPNIRNNATQFNSDVQSCLESYSLWPLIMTWVLESREPPVTGPSIKNSLGTSNSQEQNHKWLHQPAIKKYLKYKNSTDYENHFYNTFDH